MTLPRCRSLLFLIAKSRQTRRGPSTRSLSATSRIEYGATLSFRHSHLFTDASETVNAPREHPIDVIEGETAIRRFRQHVEDGNYHDARSTLVDLVHIHELGANLNLFRELRDIIITAADNADNKLLADLGISIARRGHVRFVRDEIRPLFKSDDALSSLDRALVEIEENAGPTHRMHGVFEDPSADYVVPPSAPLIPSIEELVRASLPGFLPQSVENDASMFEDSTVEYPVIRTLVEEGAPQRNSRTLERLIINNSFDQAFAMLQEMESLGSSIAPSVIFGQPAERALREGRTAEFLTWLAHVPPHREGDMTPHFQRIQPLLLQQATLDYPLLTRVVMLLAGKEYRPIVQRCLQEIVRNTKSLPALQTFLLEVESGVLQHYLTEDLSLAQERRQRYARFLRGVAVRVCSWEGRLKHALALLPSASDQNLFLTPPTYQILLKKLARTEEHQWMRTAIECEARDLARSKAFHGDEYIPPRDLNAPTISPPTDAHDIDGYIRFFRDAITYKPLAMHPHIIANFITSYLRQGYPTPGILRDLTEHAVRTSFEAMFAWTLGEMQYYRRQRQGRLIIKTFVEHFSLEGVPRAEVMNIYNMDANPIIRTLPPLQRVTGYETGRMHRAKSWMGAQHRALVWETLIYRAQTETNVRKLYGKMIEILSLHRARRAASSSQVETPRLFGAEVFMMFMKRIGYGPRPVDQLLSDMLRLGVQPTSPVCAHVLFVWARTGGKQRVLRVLQAIHDQYGPTPEPDSSNALPQTPVKDVGDYHSMLRKPVTEWDFGRLDFPPPEVSLYVHTIRGFIERGDSSGAVAAASALARVMGIENLHTFRKAPENQQLDYWLNKLEHMPRKQDKRVRLSGSADGPSQRV